MKLNQVIAVLTSVKQAAKAKTTAAYQLAQKQALFQGITRTYSPIDEAGFVYPAENQPVQANTQKAVALFVEGASELYDLALTQDRSNQMAVGNLEVGDITIATNLPVSYLLFLEKQMSDLKTFVEALPVLPIDQEWNYDANKGCWKSAAKITTKTKKINDFVVAYDATPEHPAQIREVSKDVVEGVWESVALSGALPLDEKNAILTRIHQLTQAILKARESANGIEVEQSAISADLFSYVFGTIASSTN